MNVLFLLRLWPVYGGGETVTRALANEMATRGICVHICFFKENVLYTPFIDSRIKMHRIDGLCNEFSHNESSSERVQDQLIELVKEEKIDFVVNQWWPLSYVSKIKKNTAAKLITCLHTAFCMLATDVPGLKGVIKRIFRHSYEQYRLKKSVNDILNWLPSVDGYVFLSEQFKKQFLNCIVQRNEIKKKLFSISNPLSIEKENQYDETKNKENIVLFVGRMEEGPKKVSRALHAWKIVEDSKELPNWKFILVGDGRDLDLYKEMAKKFNLQQVSFEGYQQPHPYYQKAKIFVMTSAFEGFGMTLVEAQSFGCVPLAMNSFLSVSDIIDSEKNGLLIKNEDVRGFAQAIIKTAKSPLLLENMKANALESCKKFSVENIVDQWIQLFERIA